MTLDLNASVVEDISVAPQTLGDDDKENDACSCNDSWIIVDHAAVPMGDGRYSGVSSKAPTSRDDAQSVVSCLSAGGSSVNLAATQVALIERILTDTVELPAGDCVTPLLTGSEIVEQMTSAELAELLGTRVASYESHETMDETASAGEAAPRVDNTETTLVEGVSADKGRPVEARIRRYLVVAQYVRCRTSPSLLAPIVGHLSLGTVISADEVRDGWVCFDAAAQPGLKSYSDWQSEPLWSLIDHPTIGMLLARQ